MPQRNVLKLKPMQLKEEKSHQIFAMTQETVERFNIYVSDFFETVAILREDHERSVKKNDAAKCDEIESKIVFVEQKIEELTEAMQRIADEMSSVVELVQVEKK